MTHLALKRALLPASALVALAGMVRIARADEPRKVTEPSVLNESAEVTSVVDAFDDNDLFDLHLSLGFQQTWRSSKIMRETTSNLDQFSSGGYTAGNLNVANYSETTSRLNTRADIGLYKDVALIFRLPVILANDRKLTPISGAGPTSITAQGAPGETLFNVPFTSPTRSGIEYLAVGLDVSPMNQTRDSSKPTWTLGVEGRFSVSEPMHACGSTKGLNVPGTQQSCAYPSDVNRNGVSGEGTAPTPSGPIPLEGTNFSGHRSPGVSRGTTGLEAHTYASKRLKYIEPYAGFTALFEFQNASSDFGTTDLQGALVNHPPFQGTIIGGVAIFPWEVRDQFQRIEVDLRAAGTYRSEGRDYSELFDALGSSDAPSLRNPNFATFQGGPGANSSVVNPNSEKVYTTGITDVQQHGIYTLSAAFTFQAGEYIKFNVGTSYTLEQGHVITFDQPCNPDFHNDIGASGPCRGTSSSGAVATGIPNPNYRAVIDSPGRRFRVDDSTIWDAWVNAIVMF
ncbi:MAG TPA: hypothetical protein VHC69_08170 [Polyangiaceae bacterium]|nr:hypothetical protein [Polyangiaceae bacterium]